MYRVVQIQVWVAIVSLIGVVLGGVLSYLVQVSVQRRADRGDQRRRAHEQAESRRVEQLELLREFIRVAQRAERAAEDRDGTTAWARRWRSLLRPASS
jgi:membrane protein YqaA with SNARE-associated domain